MKSSWINWVAPKSNDKCPFKKKRYKHTGIIRSCEDGGRDLSDLSVSQGTPRKTEQRLE